MSAGTVEFEVPEGMTSGEFERAVKRLFAHKVANERLAVALSLEPVEVYPHTAQQLARVDHLWRHLIDTYGVYTSSEIALLRGSAGTNRSIATRLSKEQGLRGFIRGRNKVYPRFQFKEGAVRDTWQTVSARLGAAGWDDADILLWMVAPSALLEGREPATCLDEDDPATLLEVVDHEAAGIW